MHETHEHYLMTGLNALPALSLSSLCFLHHCLGMSQFTLASVDLLYMLGM